MWWLVLMACTGTQGPAVQEPAPPATPAVEASAHESVGAWEMDVKTIRFDDDTGTLFVLAHLEAEEAVERDEPIYVGVTAVTPDAEEIDLVVQTLLPDGLDAPIMFSTGLDADVESVLIGAWDRKIEPCDVARMGCREYGYVLDGSLAAWPPGLYTHGHRQRIPSEEVAVRFAGGTPALHEAVARRLQAELAVFGSRLSPDVVEADDGPDRAEVRYRNPSDVLLAEATADALRTAGAELDVAVRQVDDLDADLVVWLPDR